MVNYISTKFPNRNIRILSSPIYERFIMHYDVVIINPAAGKWYCLEYFTGICIATGNVYEDCYNLAIFRLTVKLNTTIKNYNLFRQMYNFQGVKFPIND